MAQPKGAEDAKEARSEATPLASTPGAEAATGSQGESDDGAVDIAPRLADLRTRIDAVDRALLALLNQRAELVREVGEVKGGGARGPVYVAARERDLVLALIEANSGPFPDAAIPSVFREIISATRSLEERAKVAYLGPAGTFSHQAATRQFGAQVDFFPCPNIEEVFERTARGVTQFGVVPVENTIEGAVTTSYDGLIEHEVTICGEIKLEVAQHLMNKSGDRAQVKRVASHAQPLAQCRRWLREHLPGIELVETPSTAAAAELAAGEPDVAAIGSEVAAETYELDFVARNIEDQRGNTTRFLVIGREMPAPSEADLTSAVFTVRRDQSGALYHLLQPFARHGVNLTAVQSRPMKGKPWEYMFFVDMEGHQADAEVGAALDEAARVAHSHKILGSFPRALEKRATVLGATREDLAPSLRPEKAEEPR